MAGRQVMDKEGLSWRDMCHGSHRSQPTCALTSILERQMHTSIQSLFHSYWLLVLLIVEGLPSRHICLQESESAGKIDQLHSQDITIVCYFKFLNISLARAGGCARNLAREGTVPLQARVGMLQGLHHLGIL